MTSIYKLSFYKQSNWVKNCSAANQANRNQGRSHGFLPAVLPIPRHRAGCSAAGSSPLTPRLIQGWRPPPSELNKRLNLGYIRAQVAPHAQLRHLLALQLCPQPAKCGHRDKPSSVWTHSADSHHSSELRILADSPSKRMLRAVWAVGSSHPREGRGDAGEQPGPPQAATLEASLKLAGKGIHGATTSTDRHCQRTPAGVG